MIAQVVGALFNACWQGLAVVGIISCGLRFFSRSSAAARYAIWFAALLVIAALPAIDLGLASALRYQPTAVSAPNTFAIVRTGTVTYSSAAAHVPSRASSSKMPTTTIGYAVEVPPDRITQLRALATSLAGRVSALLSAVALPVVLAWLFFSALMLARLGLAYVRLRRVKHGLVPLGDVRVNRLIADSNRPVVVGVALDLAMPCVLGFARPAIALPATLAEELTQDDLERIVRHEHAHVRRWDDVANAVQLIVQAVMCLNPAVHMIGRSLNVEREIACDDYAVEPLSERVQYAKCLTHIAVNGFGRSRAALPAPGFFFNRKQLLVRVERLLERGHNGSTTLGANARYALAGLAIVALTVARVQLPVVAAQTHAEPARSAASLRSIPAGASQMVRAMQRLDLKREVSTRMAIGRIKAAKATFKATELAHVALAHHLLHTVAMATHNSLPAAVTHSLLAKLSPNPALDAPLALSAPVAAPHSAASTGVDFLDALAAAGYKNLKVDELVQMKNVGVDGALIDAAVRYAGSRPGVDTLVHMASVGVDADFLSHLQDSGYPRIGLEDVVRLRAIGVDPSYIRDMTAALHTRPSIDQLMQLRALGVDPGYVRSFAQVGYDKLSSNDLMRLRAVGVDADYVRMLRSKGIGGSGLSVEDLIRMKSVGVE